MKPEVGEPPARVKPHPLGREAPPAEPPARVKPHPPLRRAWGVRPHLGSILYSLFCHFLTKWSRVA